MYCYKSGLLVASAISHRSLLSLWAKNPPVPERWAAGLVHNACMSYDEQVDASLTFHMLSALTVDKRRISSVLVRHISPSPLSCVSIANGVGSRTTALGSTLSICVTICI